MTDEVVGGPGWVIGADLRPRITDAEAFRAGMSDDPLVEVVAALWSGEPLRVLELLGAATTPRMRALRADARAALGDTTTARAEYDALVEESLGTGREAVMRQHRGKVLLAAGEIEAAIADFSRALDLRRDGDAALLASSEQALRVARRRLEDARRYRLEDGPAGRGGPGGAAD
ncbi:tetratricopeptide (TPR) repeat protein [Microbacterium sp. 1154]|uniref:hypothetical protein n=1 Tax=Microbacterium sp. 1154 TaxID=2817733 RepID=UPI000E397CA4|nr:hypothetical protein [Microbacterium sp. 1154]MDR6691259.1 tetratricopeptide (TPR) repeat protein [Microbacterium sp. 1154]